MTWNGPRSVVFVIKTLITVVQSEASIIISQFIGNILYSRPDLGLKRPLG